MPEVAIVGVGLHPFGRFPGKTALSMGAEAARSALADAGLSWADMQFAVGGSYEVDQPDAAVSDLGLTGVQFTNVYNGCATAGSSLALASQCCAPIRFLEAGFEYQFSKLRPALENLCRG